MRLVLDACVLYPSVMNQLLMAAARAGQFMPVWSERILEEWALASARDGAEAEAQARGEAALMSARFPNASVNAPERDDLWLPDPADTHVLATAIAAEAEGIVTLNTKDFPMKTLGQFGLSRLDPDAFLQSCFLENPAPINAKLEKIEAHLHRADPSLTTRKILKKARLPRLGKAMETGQRQ